MAGRSDDVETEALQVVLRGGGRGQLVLAGVTGAGIDVADGERAGAAAPRQAQLRGGRAVDGEAGRTCSAVHTGVAELEALVDQGEVGQEVFRGGESQGRPVGIGAGAQVQALEREASCSTAQTVSPRGLSTRATPSAAGAPPGSPRRTHRAGEQILEHREDLDELERPDLESRRDVAAGAGRDRGGKGRSRTRARDWPSGCRSSTPAARAAGPTAPSRTASSWPRTPTPSRRAWTDGAN